MEDSMLGLHLSGMSTVPGALNARLAATNLKVDADAVKKKGDGTTSWPKNMVFF